MTETTWIFGYGSLVWRPAFPYIERLPARLPGYRRRFWQGSTDHRGVPGAPGRVVTLVEHRCDHVWGVVYSVAPEERERVLARLDHREKGGYDRLELVVEARPSVGEPLAAQALTWVATTANENYLGEAPVETIAAQVLASSGPSGDNYLYVLELEKSLREMGVEDLHVEELAGHVRRGLKAGSLKSGSGGRRFRKLD